MKLRDLCFFKEAPYGGSGSIFDAVRDEEHPQKERIVSYLENGELCTAAFGLVRDTLSDEIIGPLFMLTDGVWVWGSDLSTYVAKYNVELPEDFVEQVKGWDGQRFDVNLASIEL
ncbi:hypothetical protein ABLO27_25315 [Roseibium sp. SCPC15]|uniref:hypothetical protein n=1 Tax=Roseibium sp. SCP15 TaxID=3141376 RepID=UPI003334DE40